MDIRSRYIGGVAILSVRGRVTVGPDEAEVVPLRLAVADVLADGYRCVGVELSEVTHIDARGLAEVVAAATTVRRAGGELTVMAPSARVRQLLAITRLDTVLRVGEPEPGTIGSPIEPACQTSSRVFLPASASASRSPAA